MYGNMLSEILNKIVENNGELIYRTGLIGGRELIDLAESGRFVDEINDSRTSKHISFGRFVEFCEKYEVTFSGVISLEENGFKLYVDRVKGDWIMNYARDHDVEWYESFKMEILEVFPGALTINLNHAEMPCSDRVYFHIELGGMNPLFPESVYSSKEGSFHEKMSAPIPKYHKVELGKLNRVTNENVWIEEWITWNEVWGSQEKCLYVSEDKIPLDCNPDASIEQINEWIANNLVDQMFRDANWIKERIVEIFVAEAERLRGRTEFFELFSERVANENGGIDAHVCFYMLI